MEKWVSLPLDLGRLDDDDDHGTNDVMPCIHSFNSSNKLLFLSFQACRCNQTYYPVAGALVGEEPIEQLPFLPRFVTRQRRRTDAKRKNPTKKAPKHDRAGIW